MKPHLSLGLSLFLVLAIGASPAAAAIRHAAPTGSAPSSTCAESAPCSLITATAFASAGDQVVVHAGTYNDVSFTVLSGVTVGGASGEARPTVKAGSGTVARVSAGGTLRDMTLQMTGASGMGLEGPGTGAATLVERVFVRSSSETACSPGQALLRDSVCWTTANAGTAVSVAGTASKSSVLRNVTAVAPGVLGSGVSAAASQGAHVTIDAKNVIAFGGNIDVVAGATDTSGASAAVTLASSNYDATEEGWNGNVTLSTAQGNTWAEPVFADLAAGDFHPLAGSPTIDAGTADDALGANDLDGASRVLGSVPDAGAYEYVAPVTDPAGPVEPADTSSGTTTQQPAAGSAGPQPSAPLASTLAPPSPATDSTPPRLVVSMPAKQKAGKTVRITVACPDESCQLRVTGRLELVRGRRTTRLALGAKSAAALGSGKRVLTVTLSAKARAAVAGTLRHHGRATVKFTLVASDGAGNTTSVKKSGKLVR